HGSLIVLPMPRQCGHVVCTMKKPCACTTWPLPWHVRHTSALLPAAAPLPLHVSHAIARETFTSFVQPHTASANVSSRSTRRSAPRGVRLPLVRPPKKSPNRSPNAEKISSAVENPGPGPPPPRRIPSKP